MTTSRTGQLSITHGLAPVRPKTALAAYFTSLAPKAI
jgi:hypothetical protein